MLPPSLTELNVDSPPTIHPDEPTPESSTILLSVIATPEAELDTKMNDNKAENRDLIETINSEKKFNGKTNLVQLLPKYDALTKLDTLLISIWKTFHFRTVK